MIIFFIIHIDSAHTWSHRYLTSQTNEQIVAEFEWTARIIQLVTGVRPTMARPPFGDIDDRVRAVLGAMEYRTLLWNRDTYDWKVVSSDKFRTSWISSNFSIWANQVSRQNYGVLSLQHDLYAASAGQVPTTIQIAAKSNASLLTVSQCTGLRDYINVTNITNASFPKASTSSLVPSSLPPFPIPYSSGVLTKLSRISYNIIITFILLYAI